MLLIAVLSLLLGICRASSRFVIYYDQWHTNITGLPVEVSSAASHVILSFAGSTALSAPTFTTVQNIKSQFGNNVKVMIAVGGWGDSSFPQVAKDATTRATFARNVGAMLNQSGADGVDIDWEYPGGNGIDYKQNPNSGKVWEIEAYPELLSSIRSIIGFEKILSIAVPGLQRDMIAFTDNTGQKIWQSVDFVNIMTYDLMNRRDNVTKHHTDVAGSLQAIDNYAAIGLKPEMMNLGFAMYAKFFTVNAASGCSMDKALGCETVEMEDAQGQDTGKSGAITFEPNPEGLQGATATSFTKAMANGKTDEEAGGQYYYDSDSNLFWTWDTPAIVKTKFEKIVSAKGLGGAMVWSLGEDTKDWVLMKAVANGVGAQAKETWAQGSGSGKRRAVRYHV